MKILVSAQHQLCYQLSLDLIRGSHGWKEESRQHPVGEVNQCSIKGVDGCEMQNFQSENKNRVKIEAHN